MTVAAVLIALGWDLLGWDLHVMRLIAQARGFDLRHHWLLESVLHHQVRQWAIGLFLALLVVTVMPLGSWRRLSVRQRLTMAVGVSLALLAVNIIKRASLTSCPWELAEFGGAAHYVSHWSWGVRDGGSGRCFPGGHASSTLAFLPVGLAWLHADERADRRRGRWWIVAVLASGLLLGAVQTLRGAHYPSHTVWSALICWMVALGTQRAFSMWPTAAKAPGQNQASGAVN